MAAPARCRWTGSRSRSVRCRSTLPFTFAWDETFDVGLDTGTPVDDRDYQVPFAFTGSSNRITVDLGASSVTPEALRAFEAEMTKRD